MNRSGTHRERARPRGSSQPAPCSRALSVAIGCTLAFFCSVYVTSASPADWEKLPDGRAIIEVKGARLAMPTYGSDIELISFMDRQSSARLLLKQVLSAPDIARKFLSQATTVIVNVPNVSDRADLLLNRFKRSEFRTFDADFVLGDHAQGNCRAWEQEFSILKNGSARNTESRTIDGWTEFREGNHSAAAAYVKVENSDYEKQFIGGLSCDGLGMCHVPKCFGKEIGVYYQFSRAVFDQRSWDLINDRARELIDFVLVEWPK